MNRILLVEDDIDYGIVVKQYLEISGFEVVWASTPTPVFEYLDQYSFDIAILDIMLPIKDGFTLAKEINTNYPHLPFLFLTAKNQNFDRLIGLKLGASDYLSKTCDPEELKIRIDNILKNQINRTTKLDYYQLGAYRFYPDQLKLTISTNTHRLTERERDLLALLISYDKQIVERNYILQQLWPANDYFNGRSLDVFITRLRKYLAEDENIQITSIRGLGFEIDLALKEKE
ncbi:response regulator transcription factor [Myroides pelagicus]|uniref:Response regulator n=1 Tax=Myroides pelagicus TaxID=270914 RepID=A0A7K1GQM7_9FLAO|nr:response regulator transcription factor [Myroides pelagicus]MEC4115044.1 response regulator transcription factor [Myroides pelagicus]MTH31048.1 response regulator [Myroides pelagicus]